MTFIPRLPRFLGVLVALPQLGAVGAMLTGPAAWREPAQAVALTYAALALALLGGSWWGIAAGAPAAERRGSLGWLWVAGAAPLLAGLASLPPWVLGLMAPEPALIMLAAALLLSAGVEARLGPLAPRWWMALRVPLGIALGLATAGAAFA